MYSREPDISEEIMSGETSQVSDYNGKLNCMFPYWNTMCKVSW